MGMLFIILLSPLIGFLFSGIIGKYLPEKITGWISSLSILVSFVLSLQVFQGLSDTNGGPAFEAIGFTFLSVGDIFVDFAIQADRLTSLMMLVITGIGFLIHLYSISYMHGDKGFYKFFAYLNLFVFNMLVLVMGSNFLMLFFGWEGVGLCSYLLIGFWYRNAEYGKAARKAFIMNRIGDLGLLVGLFLVISSCKSLNYSDVFAAAKSGGLSTEMVTAICISFFIGAMGKSAQIPLYTWLPDAMAGPTPVSALIHAATMVTAGVYLVVRCNVLFEMAPAAQQLILWIGLSTSILAALIGLKQNDIKKVLAYSTVSQLGLMFIALGVGAYSAAMFHLITHAFFKALLFLGSGSVIHGMGGEQDIRKMGGLKSYMPVTYYTFLIGTLAISGMPLFSGFFSKDEILATVFTQQPIVWFLAVVSALITGVYMFRVFLVTFMGSFRGTETQKQHLHESPALITVPLIILAILSLVGGLLNLPELFTHDHAQWLKHWLSPVLGNAQDDLHHPSHSTEWMLMGLAVSVFIAAFLYTRNKYISHASVPEEDAEMTGAAKWSAHKFFVDELYDKVFVRSSESLGSTMNKADSGIFAGLMGWVSSGISYMSGLFSKVQNGRIQYYLLYMVIGVILMLVINIFI
ncbi:MAG: NADH-quinone oxidoreductase subunit [Bacteroidota bacterium]|jgi:NADH-quinone oxidoreductase subunit L